MHYVSLRVDCIKLRSTFMPRLFCSCLLVLAVTALAGCGVKQVEPIQHSAIEVPDGKNSKKIQLKRVVANINRGAEIGQIGLGLGCFKYGSITWKSGRKSIGDEELSSIFAEELKKYNYNVMGDPSELFEDNRAGAEIAVGGRITSLQYDVCYPMAGFGDWRNGNANASVSVEWQIYNTLDKKVIYKKSSSGNGAVKFQNGNDNDAVYNAFANAVQGLLADKNFLNIVMEKDDSLPGGVMGGLTDSGAMPASAPDSQADAPAQYSIQNTKLPGNLENAKKSVVVIQMPGDGHGSGFLIGNSGYILTNHHVVLDMKKARIIFSDGTRAEGRVLKSDPRQDVGLIQIDSPPVQGLPYRLEDLASATEVYAIGAPFKMALHGSLSKGIVSGYRKDIKGRWLQSDTTVNGGNSGGPLVDAQGRVVGICSWGFTGDGLTGLNFFIPIADAFRVMGIQAN